MKQTLFIVLALILSIVAIIISLRKSIGGDSDDPDKICLGVTKDVCIGRNEFKMLLGEQPVKISRGNADISQQALTMSGDYDSNGIVVSGYDQTKLCTDPPDSLYPYGIKQKNNTITTAYGAFDIYLKADIPDTYIPSCDPYNE